MPDPVWTPSLDDTELDGLSARLRAAVRDALPQLLDNAQRGADTGRTRHVEIQCPPGLTLHLEATQIRSVVRSRRPVLEFRLHGSLRSLDPGSGQQVNMPIAGECNLDLNTRAITLLRLRH